MSELSDTFILSQIAYYRKHVLSGNFADRMLIGGCLLTYTQEARKRKLIS
jgi:hypothetical protein